MLARGVSGVNRTPHPRPGAAWLTPSQTATADSVTERRTVDGTVDKYVATSASAFVYLPNLLSALEPWKELGCGPSCVRGALIDN